MNGYPIINLLLLAACSPLQYSVEDTGTEAPCLECDPGTDTYPDPTGTDADGDGWTVEAGDCNDNDASINPGAQDNTCDGIDQNCDGYDGPVPPPDGASACGGVDSDGDGYMDVNASGDVIDCNDSDPAINPGATEVCDGVDNDCDGEIDEGDVCDTGTDADGDGWTVEDGDCNDADATIYPGAEEIPNDGIDQDCDGYDLIDVDCDGYADDVDCDDEDPTVYPGAPELCDGIDNDCDGEIDEGCTEPEPEPSGMVELTLEVIYVSMSTTFDLSAVEIVSSEVHTRWTSVIDSGDSSADDADNVATFTVEVDPDDFLGVVFNTAEDSGSSFCYGHYDTAVLYDTAMAYVTISLDGVEIGDEEDLGVFSPGAEFDISMGCAAIFLVDDVDVATLSYSGRISF